MIYLTRGKNANHYTTDVVLNLNVTSSDLSSVHICMIYSALKNGQDSDHWFGHHVQHKEELIDLGGFTLTDKFYEQNKYKKKV